MAVEVVHRMQVVLVLILQVVLVVQDYNLLFLVLQLIMQAVEVAVAHLPAEAQEQARAPDPADTEGLALLLNWIEGLAVVDPPADQALEALRQALLRGRLSLELLQAGGG